jgi:hypothetical protein
MELTVRIPENYEHRKIAERYSLSYAADQHTDYYTFAPYLQHIYGKKLDLKTYMAYQSRINDIRCDVKINMVASMKYDQTLVEKVIDTVTPKSVHRKPLGLTVRLYESMYYKRRAMIKTYTFHEYDENRDRGYDELYQDMIVTNFIDEIVFQKYGKCIGAQHSFLVPEIYAYGRFHNSSPTEVCLYIIMEHIDGILLKDAQFTRDTVADVYEIDQCMKSYLLDHNDLHSSNIMVVSANNMQKLAILDFGEAACGPRKPIGTFELEKNTK